MCFVFGFLMGVFMRFVSALCFVMSRLACLMLRTLFDLMYVFFPSVVRRDVFDCCS